MGRRQVVMEGNEVHPPLLSLAVTHGFNNGAQPHNTTMRTCVVLFITRMLFACDVLLEIGSRQHGGKCSRADSVPLTHTHIHRLGFLAGIDHPITSLEVRACSICDKG